MFSAPDIRPGREFGLIGRYTDLPAFQIVNDAHDTVAALTSRMTDIEYGGMVDVHRHAALWLPIKQKRGEFIRRAANLHANVFEAARLSEEVEAFRKQVVDPFVEAFAEDVG